MRRHAQRRRRRTTDCDGCRLLSSAPPTRTYATRKRKRRKGNATRTSNTLEQSRGNRLTIIPAEGGKDDEYSRSTRHLFPPPPLERPRTCRRQLKWDIFSRT